MEYMLNGNIPEEEKEAKKESKLLHHYSGWPIPVRIHSIVAKMP